MANDTMLENSEGERDLNEIHLFLNWIEQICDPDAKLKFPEETIQHCDKRAKIDFVSKEVYDKNTQFIKSFAQMIGERDLNEIHLFLTWIEQICDPDVKLKFPEETIQHCDKRTKIDFVSKEVYDKNSQFIKSLADTYAFNSTFRGKGDFLFESFMDKDLTQGIVRKITNDGELEFFGCFLRGELHGLCIKSTLGGGFLMSSTVDFTGNDVIFLYPDGLTALVGQFEKGVMKAAHATEVIGIQKSCHNSNLCPCSNLTLRPRLQSGTKKVHPVFHFDISTESQISSSPHLQDPYEMLFVGVSTSTLPFAGEGLFAIDEIEPSTVVAFYNGIRIKEGETVRDVESVDGEDEDWSCYRLNLTSDTVIDIPRDMSDVKNYSASLGHKIIHSFTPNCQFEDFNHPRFGLIKCIVTISHILSGEELTANYEYKLSDAPSWYKKLWAKHQKQVRKLPDWNSALKSKSAHVSQGSLPSSAGSSRTISESRTPDTIPEEDEIE